LVVATLGAFVLAGVIVICCAAYIIRAESFEFSAVILKLVSISIKIISPDGRGRRKRRAAKS
jgi:hypothetical protein